MSEATTPAEHFRSLFDQTAPDLPGAGNAWVAERRRAAMSRFSELGFPEPREEAWKYTRLKPMARHAFALPPAETGADVTADDVAPYDLGETGAHRLVFVDGRFAPDLSRIEDLPVGVTLEPMSRALTGDHPALQRHLGAYADPEGTPFVALNTALMTDGIFLHLPDGVRLERPVHMLVLTTAAADEVSAHYRNLMVAEDGAAGALVEETQGLTDEATAFNNFVTEAVAGTGARVDVHRLQEEGTGTYQIAAFEGYQAADSHIRHTNIALGGRLTRADIGDVLDAEGAEVDMDGLYLGDDRQHVDTHTRIDHLRPRCVSREHYKGVLDGRSRGVFNGRVVVHPQAQETESDQQNNNLLLSRGAEVDPKPELEIFADDVSCTHGATVGQLDDDALFYLQSRGIATEEARNLLIFGFANEIIERIDIEPLRARLEERLLSRLPHAQSMEE